jgi:hypothetical protein
MTLAVTDITNLKTVDTSSGNKLRWVESKATWYQLNVASSDTADDDNIVLPNSSVGRWVKQEAKLTNNGLYYSEVTGTQTLTASVGTQYGCKSSTGAIIFDLPASPTVGGVIKIMHYSSGLSNVTQINRNGKPILGSTASDGIELYTYGSSVILTYIDSTVGWAVDNSGVGTYRKLADYTNTFTYSSGGDTNGLFYWLGTNEGSLSWVNPVNTNSGSPAKLWSFKSESASAISELSDRSTSEVYCNTNFFYGSIFSFIISRDAFREFRVSKLALRNNTSNDYAIRSFSFKGLRYSDFGGYTGTDLSGNSSNTAIFYGLPGWEVLKNYPSTTVNPTTASAWGIYDIDADDYYSAFQIVLTGNISNGTNSFWLGEVELYGDVRS